MKKALRKLSKLESSVIDQSLKYDNRLSSLESNLNRVMHEIGISYIKVKIELFKVLINGFLNFFLIRTIYHLR